MNNDAIGANTPQNAAGCSMWLLIVFLIFLVLKLARVGDVANWSWWWVCSPLWMYMGLLVIAVILLALLPKDFGE